MATEQHQEAEAIGKAYVEHWAAGDFDSLRDLLDDNVLLTLPNSGETIEPSFVFTGIEDALGYLRSAFALFEHLTFREVEWVVSDDARYLYMHAFGEMVTRAEGKDYDNVYVLRLELAARKIVAVREYTNPIIWNNLGVG